MFLTERRRHTREPLTLRFRLQDGRHARTRNVCEGGLYVIVPPGVRVDEWIALELLLPLSALRLRAVAQVMRTEPLDRGTGVALRLHRQRLLCDR
jgi:hypothetical protein